MKKKGKVGYLGIVYVDVFLYEEVFENIFRCEFMLKGFWNFYLVLFLGEEWCMLIEFVK